MNTDIKNMHGKDVREFMEAVLDYEIRGSLFYPIRSVLKFCKLDFLLGLWFGWKVSRKVSRMINRPPENIPIISGRPEGAISNEH